MNPATLVSMLLLFSAPHVVSASTREDIALSELVRRSERIVIGRVTRILQVRRTDTRRSDVTARKWSIANENGWSAEPSVPIAEVEVERSLKGLSSTDKVYYIARNRSTADTTRAVIGERAFFFLNYDERLRWEDSACVIAFNAEVGEQHRLCDLVDQGRGRMTIVGGKGGEFVRCSRDVRCGASEALFGNDGLSATRALPYSALEAEIEQAIERQMPIFRAYEYGYTDDGQGRHASYPWELWVFGDGVCCLRVSTLQELDLEFDGGAQYVSWLATKFEREGFRRMPELIGSDAPDTSGASLSWTTLDASKHVFICDTLTITPATDELTRGALRLLIAMRNVFDEPLAFDSREHVRKLLGEKP